MNGHSSRWRMLLRRKSGWLSLAVVLLYVLMAIGFETAEIVCEARHLTPFPQRTSTEIYAPPGPSHWLGTDYQGRDVLIRAAAASAVALKVGLISGALAALIGTVLGMCSGYFGGWIDDLTVWLYSTFASIPSLLFILALALLVSRGFLPPALEGGVRAMGKLLHTEPGTLAVYLAIGLTGWVSLCRVVRSETMKLRQSSYIAAAKVSGVGSFSIVFRHVLPNVFHLVVIYFTLNFAAAVMMEVIVSYLGFGVQSAPSWGVMISDGQERLWRGVWWEIAGATGFMFVLVLALNILGDTLRDQLDPKSAK